MTVETDNMAALALSLAVMAKHGVNESVKRDTLELLSHISSAKGILDDSVRKQSEYLLGGVLNGAVSPERIFRQIAELIKKNSSSYP